MKAVILAAGLGTRLGDLTKDNPKVMLPIGGKPVLEWQILNLKKYGVRDFFINLHYLPQIITEYFGDGKQWGVSINYSLEHPEILGTAGALKKMELNLRGSDFFLIYGDMFNNLNFQKLYDFYKKNGGLGAVVAKTNPNPKTEDVVLFDANYKIGKILKKPSVVVPEKAMAMKAIYIFNDKILDFIDLGMTNLDHEVLPKVISQGENFYAYHTKDYLLDIGQPDSYQRVQQDFDTLSGFKS